MKKSHTLMSLLLPLTSEWVAQGFFDTLPDQVGYTSPGARIYFLTELQKTVRLWPLKLFADPHQRTRLLEAIQQSLDAAITQEQENETDEDYGEQDEGPQQPPQA
jgi:type III secretion system TyeA family effector delivery regulator